MFQDEEDIGREGVRCYEEGDYKRAAHLLMKAIQRGELYYAFYYADICQRNLDGENRPDRVAAEWYLVAAHEGDGEIIAYLDSLSPEFSAKLHATPRADYFDLVD